MIKKEKFPDCVFLAVIRYLVSCVCVRETVTWDSSVSLCESNRRGDERAHDSVMKSKNERLTVCTECNLISSCICIQSLCITHTLWCSAGYRICMKCMMSCGAGSDPLIDPLTGNCVPTAQTWLSLSSPPTSVLVASRRCSNMRGEIWTYSAHTHTHTPVEYWLCVLCLFAALSWSVRWSLLSICLRRLRRTNVPSCTGCQVSVDTMLLLITSTCFISTMSDPRRRTPTEAQRAPMTYIKR